MNRSTSTRLAGALILGVALNAARLGGAAGDSDQGSDDMSTA
jgi:hypothetical protein